MQFILEMIYLDNASTTYPKPEEMKAFLATAYDRPLGSYGRSRDGYTLELSQRVELLRDRLASLIGVDGQGEHICFTKNATEAINIVLRGLPLLKSSEVLLSPMEHNAVARPTYALDTESKPFLLPAQSDGLVDCSTLADLLPNLTVAPRLCVLNAMSNVNGLVQDLHSVIKIVRKAYPACLFLIDAAQAIPYIKIEAEELGIDFVAITGHKGLLGPTGTGALYIRNPESISPLLRGGTGFRSFDLADTLHLPERFEVGTLNLIGLSAWYMALLHYPEGLGISSGGLHSYARSLEAGGRYRVFTALDPHRQGPLFSLLPIGEEASILSDKLYHKHGIATRVGLHCAPLAHQTIGTEKSGTLRVSISPYSTWEELYRLEEALHSC